MKIINKYIESIKVKYFDAEQEDSKLIIRNISKR